jgi:hypothetical protein
MEPQIVAMGGGGLEVIETELLPRYLGQQSQSETITISS